VLSKDGVILPNCLPPRIVSEAVRVHPAAVGADRTLADVEAEHIRAVMKSAGGNRSRAAHILGISTTTLWRKLKDTEPRDGSGKT
jgi:transcriptional regulator, propionate catabolism operon regulatory protein